MVKQFYLTYRRDNNLGQSWLEYKDNKGVFNIPKSSRTGATQSAALVLYPGQSLDRLPFYIDAVTIFKSPSWLGLAHSGFVKYSLNKLD